jgi:hypothetical protein
MDAPHPPGSRDTRLIFVALLAAGLLAGLLTGCSTASGDPATDPPASVASVPNTASAARAPATTPTASVDGPLIRADTSYTEIERYMVAWGACLKNHGVPGITKQTSMKMDPSLLTTYPEAAAACASKRPEQVTDRYKRQHPQAFQAHLQQFIRCMKNAGQKIVFIPPDGWGVSDEQAAAGYTPNERLSKTCEKKAYGQ